MAIGCALIVALLSGPIILFQTHALWDMESSNARTWNATLNTSATFGVNIIPFLIMIIIVVAIVGIISTKRGF